MCSSSTMMMMSESDDAPREYAGVIFDFNGTLIWDTFFHEEAWMAFSASLGRPVTRSTYYREIHGKTTKDILEMLIGHEVDKQEIAILSREKERLYREICLASPDRFKFAPGVERLLDELKSAKVPMTIATASEIENVEFFIKQFDLGRWFETDLIVYDDGSVRNKPFPDIYLKAAERLQLDISELVVVEDSYYGVLAAKDAACGYLILTGEQSARHEELRQIQEIDRFIDHFDQIDRSLLIRS